MVEFKIVLDDDSMVTQTLQRFFVDGRIDSEIAKKSILGYVLNQELREIIDEYYDCVKDAKFSDGLENVLDNFDMFMTSTERLYQDTLKFIDTLSKDFNYFLDETDLVPPIVLQGICDNFSKAQDCLSDAEDFYAVVKVLDGIRAWKSQLRLKQATERVNTFRDQFLGSLGVDLFNMEDDDEETK